MPDINILLQGDAELAQYVCQHEEGQGFPKFFSYTSSFANLEG